jgi:hypothetical protein
MMATVKDECDKASRAVEQNEVGASVGCMWPEMPRPRGHSSCRRVRRRSRGLQIIIITKEIIYSESH